MGNCADAIICYGMHFEEGCEFPWSERDNIDDWWIYDVLGFKHSKEVYDKYGNYLPEMTNEDAMKYCEEYHACRMQNPCPIKLVRSGGIDYHSIIIAIPSTVIIGDWNAPLKINVPNCFSINSQDFHAYYKFMDTYFKDLDQKFKWFLVAYWG